MAVTNKTQVSVSGITPALSGEGWFVIDKSGTFFLDKTVTATIWLVGGGCDGTAGKWNGNILKEINSEDIGKYNPDSIIYDDSGVPRLSGNPVPGTGTDTSYSGAGGDGGYVFTVTNVKIPKNQSLISVIAESNDKDGTSLDIQGVLYQCGQPGCIYKTGGEGGNLKLPSFDNNEGWWRGKELLATSEENRFWIAQTTPYLKESTAGKDGVSTPYGYVGSSGGGGTVCNGVLNADNGKDGGEGAGNGQDHRNPGTDAEHYGCGGGGGAICGWVAKGQPGGKGKQGCIIISYVVEQSTLVVQKHYKKVCNTHKTCNTDYYSNNSHHSCCTSDSGSCGCGNSNQGYSDSIPVKTTTAALQRQTDALSQKLQNAESENAALQSRITELQTQIDMIQ